MTAAPPEDDPARPGGPPRRGLWKALPLAVLLVAAAVAIFALDLGRFLSFESIAENHAALKGYARANPAAPLLAVAVYALVVALSIPGAVFLTLAAGLVFGIVLGTALVVAGATLGAAAVFLAARTALAAPLAARAGPKLNEFRAGFQKNAFSYLLTLRLVPLFPFWLVNIVPAVLGMRLGPYVLATAIGIIPGSAVYASVGAGMDALIAAGKSPDLGVIFQPRILLPLLALAALSLVPVVARRRKGRAGAGPGSGEADG